ncbi:hypothetical protein CsSME_00034933 [Camellia sinensis var. sinensis]
MARTPAVVVRWLVVVVICCCTTTHLLLLLPTAEAIWLNLPSSGTKCVSEEIQNNVVVLADYGVVGDETHSGALPTISASVSLLTCYWYGVSLFLVEKCLGAVNSEL